MESVIIGMGVDALDAFDVPHGVAPAEITEKGERKERERENIELNLQHVPRHGIMIVYATYNLASDTHEAEHA